MDVNKCQTEGWLLLVYVWHPWREVLHRCRTVLHGVDLAILVSEGAGHWIPFQPRRP